MPVRDLDRELLPSSILREAPCDHQYAAVPYYTQSSITLEMRCRRCDACACVREIELPALRVFLEEHASRSVLHRLTASLDIGFARLEDGTPFAGVLDAAQVLGAFAERVAL